MVESVPTWKYAKIIYLLTNLSTINKKKEKSPLSRVKYDYDSRYNGL